VTVLENLDLCTDYWHKRKL